MESPGIEEEGGHMTDNNPNAPGMTIKIHARPDTEATDGTSHHEPATERTAAFFIDSRASTIALAETIESMITAYGIQRAVVDLLTPMGVVVAKAFRQAGLPYDVFAPRSSDAEDMGSPEHREAAEAIRLDAESSLELSPESIAELNANFVVIPAMLHSDKKTIDIHTRTEALDLTPGTVSGLIVKWAKDNDLDVLAIDTPENGLIRREQGRYERRVLRFIPQNPDEEGLDDAEP